MRRKSQRKGKQMELKEVQDAVSNVKNELANKTSQEIKSEINAIELKFNDVLKNAQRKS